MRTSRASVYPVDLVELEMAQQLAQAENFTDWQPPDLNKLEWIKLKY